MAPAESKRLVGRKIAAIACFDSFGKLAMTMLASCRREGADATLLLLELNNLTSRTLRPHHISVLEERTTTQLIPLQT